MWGDRQAAGGAADWKEYRKEGLGESRAERDGKRWRRGEGDPERHSKGWEASNAKGDTHTHRGRRDKWRPKKRRETQGHKNHRGKETDRGPCLETEEWGDRDAEGDAGMPRVRWRHRRHGDRGDAGQKGERPGSTDRQGGRQREGIKDGGREGHRTKEIKAN